MTLEDEPVSAKESRLRSGEMLRDALEGIDFECVDAVLFNCSQPEVMAEAIKLAVELMPGGKDIGVYANGFRPITNNIEANDGYSTSERGPNSQRLPGICTTLETVRSHHGGWLLWYWP